MAERFHERFDIEVGQNEARVRFVNRAHNEIFTSFLYRNFQDYSDRVSAGGAIASALGDRYQSAMPEQFIGQDFYRNLHAIEAYYGWVGKPYRPTLDAIIENILAMSEKDVGVRWASGKFSRTGVPLLDGALVNDPLKWLRGRDYKAVVEAYERGLGHLLGAEKEPSRAADVITDMHEALEGVAKRVTGRDANLSANAELFISKVKASEGYKHLLKEYLVYANEGLRHAAGAGKDKPMISVREAESFLYLTGLFIRLAME